MSTHILSLRDQSDQAIARSKALVAEARGVRRAHRYLKRTLFKQRAFRYLPSRFLQKYGLLLDSISQESKLASSRLKLQVLVSSR